MLSDMTKKIGVAQAPISYFFETLMTQAAFLCAWARFNASGCGCFPSDLVACGMSGFKSFHGSP